MKPLLLLSGFLALTGCVSDRGNSASVSSPSKLAAGGANLDAKTIESWGRQKEFFMSKDFEIIPWESARALLLDRRVVGGKQYHTGWITLYGSSGEKFLTRLTGYDDIHLFFAENNLTVQGFGTE